MNIIKRELRANLKPLIIWSLCVVFLCLVAGAEFSVYKDTSAELNKMIQSFPESMRLAFSFDVIRFDEARGFYSYIGQYMVLMALIFAALAGAKILSKEIRKKTAETTFTLPLTRRYIISMKLIAAFLNCIIFTAIMFLLTLATFSPYDPGPDFAGRVFVLMLFILLLQLLFVLAGLFISVLTKSHKRTGIMIASITVVLYLLSFIAKLGEKMKCLRYFTPFEYFPVVKVMHGHKLELFGFIVVPVLIALFFSVSFVLVRKKDIY